MAKLQFAAGIMQLPGAEQLGANILNQFYQAQQQGQQYQQTEGRMSGQFNEQQAADAVRALQGQQNWQAQYDASREAERVRAANDAARLRLDQGRYTLEERRTAAAEKTAGGKLTPIAAIEAQLGKPVAGHQWIEGANGRPVQVPIPGTPAANDAVDKIDAINEGMRSVDFMLDTAFGQPHKTKRDERGDALRPGGRGFEAFGGESAPMAAAYASLRSAVLKAEQAGVLDKGEREDFDKRIANPSDWTSFATDTQRKGLEDYKRKLERKMKAFYIANPGLIPAPPGAQ
jgi:hypothetical protein